MFALPGRTRRRENSFHAFVFPLWSQVRVLAVHSITQNSRQRQRFARRWPGNREIFRHHGNDCEVLRQLSNVRRIKAEMLFYLVHSLTLLRIHRILLFVVVVYSSRPAFLFLSLALHKDEWCFCPLCNDEIKRITEARPEGGEEAEYWK